MDIGNLDLPAMRRAATGTLGVLVAVYLLTFTITDPGTFIRLLRAAAGAGIVGALADWFAVVALFRHPLGLPIPHTALLPRNQARVADNVGRFIEEHFLQPDLVVAKLRESHLSARVAEWFLGEGHAEQVVRPVLNSLAQILRADLPPGLVDTVGDLLRGVARETADNSKTTTEVAELLREGFRGDALTEIVSFLHETVAQNHDTVRNLVRDNSRWWIASRLDRNAADLIVNGLLSVLAEMSNPDSALRHEFEDAAEAVLQNVATRERLQHVISTSVDAYLASDRFGDSTSDLIHALKTRLASYLDEDTVANAILAALHSTAQRVSDDAKLQDRIDSGIADFIEKLIPELRPHVGAFVAQTIRDWDPDLLVERFETEAGRDLQFIRINGAILGFVIGGGLFAIEHAIG